MTRNWTYSGIMTPTAVAVVIALCPVAVVAQPTNPWNPYPVQLTQPVPQPIAPAPKPKYYQEPAVGNPTAQATAPTASRFAPADLSQHLSAPPRRAPNAAPYGYQDPAFNPYSNSPAYSGQPQGYANGYPQGYQMNAPPNLGGYGGGYGGYGPPIIGNNSWGGAPGNNFFPFGF